MQVAGWLNRKVKSVLMLKIGVAGFLEKMSQEMTEVTRSKVPGGGLGLSVNEEGTRSI